MLKTLLALLFVVYTPDSVPTDVGTYPIKVSHEVNGETVDETFNLTVTDDNTVIEEGIAIDAKNFTVDEDTEITKETVISMSQAKAWNTKTLEEYEITRVDINMITEKQYTATIYSFDNIKTSIDIVKTEDYYQNINVLDKDYVIEDETYFSNFAYTAISFSLPIVLLAFLFIFVMRRHNRKINLASDKISNAFSNINEPKH